MALYVRHPGLSFPAGSPVPDIRVQTPPLATIVVPGRVEGYDLARAIAVTGMILVNFHSIFFSGRTRDPGWLVSLSGLLYGRAAALFVMLAGLGLALMSRRARLAADGAGLALVRARLYKRSLVLALMGMIFLQWWGSDILHYYGIFLSAGALLLTCSNRRLWAVALAFFLTFVLIYSLTWDDPGSAFWIADPGRVAGFVDDLFFNGPYAVFPWLAFLVVGIWFGRDDILANPVRVRWVFWSALVVFLGAEGATRYLPDLLGSTVVPEDGLLEALLVEDVFPVTPIFAISAVASSLLVIVLALTITGHSLFSRFSPPLVATGKMSLTIYIAHILIGLEVDRLDLLGQGTASYPYAAASFTVGFCIGAMLFSHFWLKRFSRGPLEWFLRWASHSLLPF